MRADTASPPAADGLASDRELARDRAERLVGIGYAVAATALVLQAASHVVAVGLLDGDLWSLNADAEGNAVSWAGSAATFAAALGALLLALMPTRIDRRLLTLALLAAAFSLDDAVAIHERLAESVTDALDVSVGAGRLVWPALYAPALVATLFLLLETSRRVFAPSGRIIRLGVVLLVVAVGAEAIGAILEVGLDVRRESWPDVAEVAVEESAELAGWLLLAFGLAGAVLARAAEDTPAE